jgi:hypothetical protein
MNTQGHWQNLYVPSQTTSHLTTLINMLLGRGKRLKYKFANRMITAGIEVL